MTSSQSQQPQQVVVLGGGSKFKKLTNKKELVEVGGYYPILSS